MEESSELFKNEGYLLEELLARDTWGELYCGIYVPHRRPVLFRRFAEAFADNAVWQLTAAEVQAWARVDHQGILQPLDWDNAPGGPYVATAVPSGEQLGALMDDAGGLADNDAEIAFAALVSAVEAARCFGVLHLGLDLTNIWVSEEGQVSVSEFGLWYVSAEFPQVERPSGPFLAPEQRDAGRPGATTDVYSLALIMVAFRHGMEGAAAAASGDYSALMKDTDAHLLMRCLETNPLARPHSASALVEGRHVPPGDDRLSLRDCPVCRLKEEIARSQKPGRNFAERLLGFDDAAAHNNRETPPRRDFPQSSIESGHLRKSAASKFPWVAIAALAIATLAVWWLVFR